MRSSSPRTASAGLMPCGLKLTMRVRTNPGCRIATAMPRDCKSMASDLPAMFRATFDMR